MQKRSKIDMRAAVLTAAVAVAAIGQTSVQAAAINGTWNGGTGTNYFTTGNWTSGTVTQNQGATATIATGGTIVIDNDLTLGNITGTFNNGTSLNLSTAAGKALTLDVASGTPTITLSSYFSRYDYLKATIAGTKGLTYVGKSNVLVLQSGTTWTNFSGGFTIAPNTDGSMVYAQGSDVLPHVDLTMTPGTGTNGYGNTKLVINGNTTQAVGTLSSTINGSDTAYISAWDAANELTGGTPSGTNTAALATLTIGSANTGTFNGIIGSAYNNGGKAVVTNSNTQNIAIIKQGAGTQTLAGANTYTGGTTINLGTLKAGNASAFGTGAILVNAGTLDLAGYNVSNTINYKGGSIAHATGSAANIHVNNAATLNTTGLTIGGTTTVDAGATLNGTGTLGNLVVSSGATLAPGNSPGQLTASTANLGGNTIMGIGGTTLGSGYDNLNVTTSGGLTYGGTLTVQSYNSYDLAQAGTYTLFSISGTPSADFTSVTVNGVTLSDTAGVWSGSNNGASYIFSDSTGTLAVTVPEPAMLGLAALAGLGLLTRRQRKA